MGHETQHHSGRSCLAINNQNLQRRSAPAHPGVDRSHRERCSDGRRCSRDRAPILKVIESENAPSLYNDPQLTERLATAIGKAIGTDNMIKSPPLMASEDFGHLSLDHQIPSFYFWLGAMALRKLPRAANPQASAVLALKLVRAVAGTNVAHRSQSNDDGGARVDEEVTLERKVKWQLN